MLENMLTFIICSKPLTFDPDLPLEEKYSESKSCWSFGVEPIVEKFVFSSSESLFDRTHGTLTKVMGDIELGPSLSSLFTDGSTLVVAVVTADVMEEVTETVDTSFIGPCTLDKLKEESLERLLARPVFPKPKTGVYEVLKSSPGKCESIRTSRKFTNNWAVSAFWFAWNEIRKEIQLVNNFDESCLKFSLSWN